MEFPFNVPIYKLDMMPNVSGVYVAESLGDVLYVGQAGDLRERWKAHHMTGQLLAYPDVVVRWVECSRADLLSVERRWIEELKPALNRPKRVDGERAWRLAVEGLAKSNIGRLELRVLLLLCSDAASTGAVMMSQGVLAKRLDTYQPNVCTAIRKLVAGGYISKRAPSVYQLAPSVQPLASMNFPDETSEPAEPAPQPEPIPAKPISLTTAAALPIPDKFAALSKPRPKTGEKCPHDYMNWMQCAICRNA